ncbi:hypothetical protein AURDEDRAFT_166913 [Auricularia subglabra TFB-10046 SS5]|nr:hypothetical protein AURDEDRAFT_166913 [Auricularia subglabra TFB-10046 SS5]
MLSATSKRSLAAPAPFTALTVSKELTAAGSGKLNVATQANSHSDCDFLPQRMAIRGLENEVSSIAFTVGGAAQGTLARIWIAAGQHLFCFDLDETKLVMTREDAVVDKRILTEDLDDNVLNEIALNKSHIAFTCDSGLVGIYDPTLQDVRFLKSKHNNVSGPIAFIPSRPRDGKHIHFFCPRHLTHVIVVSGGYDCALLHSDYLLGTYLSSFDFGNVQPDGPQQQQTSLSPPFVHAMSISSSATIACGLADGRLWLGFGGVKTSPTAKKKSKKWEGLDPKHGRFFDIATGPIVGVAWKDDALVFTATLSGVLKLHDVASSEQVTTVAWEAKTSEIAKVNAVAFSTDQESLTVAGVSPSGKGAIEIWHFSGADGETG